MNKESLANKYRPQVFEDVCSQEAVIQILRNEIQNNTLPHGLLLSGPSGTGKTTLCRIIAKNINAQFVEVNGADKNGVEECRGLNEEAKKKSAINTYKIIYIDECHMITNAGQNVLLKILEDCPEHTIFMLSTTNTEKILPTIMSRVQHFKLSRIPTKTIFERLKYVCDQEKFKYDIQALDYISKLAQGGMRTALSYLDTVIALNNEVTVDATIKSLGINSIQQNMDMLYALYKVMFHELAEKREEYTKTAIELITMIYNNGQNLNLFVNQFYTFLVDVSLYKTFNNSFLNTELPETEDIAQELNKYDTKNIVKILNRFELFKESLNKSSVNLLKSFQAFIRLQNKE